MRRAILAISFLVTACGADPAALPTEPAPPHDHASAGHTHSHDDPASDREHAPAAPVPETMRPLDPATAPDHSAPTDAAIIPRSVRILALHEHEPLGSESRAIAAIQTALERHRFTVELAHDGDDEDESAVARAWLAGTKPASLPTAWRGSETLLVLHLAAPLAQRSGTRVARGVDGILVVRPPSREPIFTARADERTPFAIAGSHAALGPWLTDLLDGASEGEGS